MGNLGCGRQAALWIPSGRTRIPLPAMPVNLLLASCLVLVFFACPPFLPAPHGHWPALRDAQQTCQAIFKPIE